MRGRLSFWSCLALLSVLGPRLSASEFCTETLRQELVTIETLLISSEMISVELSTRLTKREKQLRDLEQNLSDLARTNDEQLNALVALRSEQRRLRQELATLRQELESWRDRSANYRALLAQLETELEETSISLMRSEETSETLRLRFDDYEASSTATIRRARIVAVAGWVVAAGILAAVLF